MTPRSWAAAIQSALLLGICAASQAQQPPDPNLLSEIPNQRPGTSIVVPLDQMPPALRDSFSLKAQQARNGLDKKANSAYFMSPATPYALALFERLDNALIRDRALLAQVFDGRVAVVGEGGPEPLSWVGFTREGRAKDDGKIRKIAQVYRMKGGEMFALQQWNYVADRATIISSKENMNASVNGSPATLVVQANDSGQALWTLVWAAGDYHYQLSASGVSVSPESAARILAVAATVHE